MEYFKKFIIFSAAGLLLSSVSCGSGGGSGDNQSESSSNLSGLDKSLKENELTAAEARRQCRSISDLYNSSVGLRRFCEYRGVTDAISTGGSAGDRQLNCGVSRDDCLNHSSTRITVADTSQCDQAWVQLRDCEADVEEYENCILDRAAHIANAFGRLSCENTSSNVITDLQQQIDEFPDTSACRTLFEDCPNLRNS